MIQISNSQGRITLPDDNKFIHKLLEDGRAEFCPTLIKQELQSRIMSMAGIENVTIRAFGGVYMATLVMRPGPRLVLLNI